MFKRANEWLSKRIAETRQRRQGDIAVSESGIQIAHDNASQLIPWRDVIEVQAFLRDAYLGDNLGLTLRTRSGRELTVMEHDAPWTELSRALELYLPGSLPYAEWSLRTAFVEQTRRSQVYRRGDPSTSP